MTSLDIPVESAISAATAAEPTCRVKPARNRVAELVRQFETLRYYRPRQIVHRTAAILRRRLAAGLPVERFLSESGPLTLTVGTEAKRIADRRLEHRREQPLLSKRVDEIERGRLTFLGRSLDLGTPIEWHSSQLEYMPRLWQFQLHYHEWLLDLAAAASPPQPAAIWDHVRHWIAAYSGSCERDAGDAWHPFCISRRIPAWLSLWGWHAPPADLQEIVARSLCAQAAFLARRIENDLGGNHLLENARALVLAGAVLRSATGDGWLQQGQAIFEAELTEQVLPHGEHFERSPMYHCQMIEAVEDVRDATARLRPQLSGTCARAAERMHAFTAAILNPDGRIPLFGDACFDEAAVPSIPGARVQQSPAATLGGNGAQQTGDYWTFRADGDFLLFDAGAVGPDHLPAHAHADLLTLEASFDHQRFIVDSGTYDYEGGEMRQYCRSTAAHNVLEIDGQSQCDVWSRFRMGRRGWPSALTCGAADGIAWACATHNAYRHLGVATVGRWIACGEDESWIIADWAIGRGRHALVNRLHLHPDVAVTQVSDACLRLEREGVPRYLSAIGGNLQVARGWYCPRFGVRVANPVVELQAQSSLPAVLAWQFTRDRPSAIPQLAVDRCEARIERCGANADRTHRLSLEPDPPIRVLTASNFLA